MYGREVFESAGWGLLSFSFTGSAIPLIRGGPLLAMRAAERANSALLAAAAISPAGLVMSDSGRRLASLLGLVAPVLRWSCRIPMPPKVVQRAAAAAYGHFAGRGLHPDVARMYGRHLRGGMHDVHRLNVMALALAMELQGGPYQLDRIRVPLLLLWGARDPFCLVVGAKLVLDAQPNSRLVVYEGSGHCAQLERPVEIAAELAALPVLRPE